MLTGDEWSSGSGAAHAWLHGLAFARANRAKRKADAGDRIVELRMPLGIELDEDKEGNVFVKKVEPTGRAAKSGMVFEGDYVAMVSATCSVVHLLSAPAALTSPLCSPPVLPIRKEFPTHHSHTQRSRSAQRP